MESGLRSVLFGMPASLMALYFARRFCWSIVKTEDDCLDEGAEDVVEDEEMDFAST